jgi:cell division septum initiation protein DivIVA
MVVQLVQQAWSEVPAEIVQKSFVTTGISADLNGTDEEKVKVYLDPLHPRYIHFLTTIRIVVLFYQRTY